MRKLLVIIISFIISIEMVSCAVAGNLSNKSSQSGNVLVPEDTAKDNGPVKGGVLKLFSTVPDTLNPLLTKNTFVKDFTNLIFESLIKINKDQQVVPVLAEKWDVSEDGLIWTFYIRKDVFWHNGMPFTADDVKFTFDTIQNSSVKSIYKENLKNISVYSAVDSSTFRIFVKKQDSFTAELMNFPIISKDYYIGENVKSLKSKNNMKPVGTGPFKYVSKKGSLIILSANNKWWNSQVSSVSSGKSYPYISEIDIKTFKSSSEAENAFQAGEIDVAYIQYSDFEKYSSRLNMKMRKYPSNKFEFISYNTTNGALRDKSVRQAIAYAIDRGKLIDDVISGGGVISDIPIIPGTWLYNSYYLYDRHKALDLLSKAGWTLQGGAMYNSYYGHLRLEILVNSNNAIRCKIANKISSQLKSIGIEATVKKVTWEQEISEVKSTNYDLAILGLEVSTIPDISFAYSSLERYTGFNFSRYNNKDVDSYLDRILTEKNPLDATNMRRLYTEMEAIISSDVPYLGLFFYNNAVIYNKKICGDLNPSIWDKLSDVSKWYLAAN